MHAAERGAAWGWGVTQVLLEEKAAIGFISLPFGSPGSHLRRLRLSVETHLLHFCSVFNGSEEETGLPFVTPKGWQLAHSSNRLFMFLLLELSPTPNYSKSLNVNSLQPPPCPPLALTCSYGLKRCIVDAFPIKQFTETCRLFPLDRLLASLHLKTAQLLRFHENAISPMSCVRYRPRGWFICNHDDRSYTLAHITLSFLQAR